MKLPLFCLFLTTLPLSAQPFLVENGQPRAEIVIAETPQRSSRLAADELQTTVEKMSGARLPIVTAPSDSVSVQIFVGASVHAQKRGITAENLDFGAYRIVSGENWLALIGDDTDFVPKEPWARNNGDRTSGKLQRAWEKASGTPFGAPNGGIYKNRKRLPGNLGLPDGAAADTNETLEIWGHDERGSFNAVCGFLRKMGVRWYLPGQLGEIVPDTPTIALPKNIGETVRPDFEFRQFNVRFGSSDAETMRWAMRLGVRNPYGLMIAHGMHAMTHPEPLKTAHPDWFALYGGKRDTQTGKRLNHLCYSNPELFQATVKWARALFDVYDFRSVSIMPPDAYISICQCPLCEGKDVPEMGSRGKLSNHVWEFVNRVAREVGKTHPDKLIVCCAYGANTLPPTNISKLEPNVQVVIVGGRRPRNSLPEQREPIRQLREGWLAKTDKPVAIFENYPFTGRGTYLPAFVARTIGHSINATKGVSRGEDIWLSWPRTHDAPNIGFDHFQIYFTARMWWGGKNQDVMALLEEYCRLFYGPAGSQMQAFFEFCEANYQAMETDKEKTDAALKMFDAAMAKVDPGSVYARRLTLIDQFLNALRSKSKQLGQKRGPVPKLRTVWEPKEPIVIDGKLDDQYWRECPTSSAARLRELQTGRRPVFGTNVMAGWDRGGQNLFFGIRCEERPGEPPNIATAENEDQALWYGDVVEIEIATDSHSYYQIAVNPAGALVDLDRGADKSSRFRWQSQAEVATHVADDHWTLEIRIPVTDDENDPLNQVVGRKPSASLPWHINICRQRIRENGSEHSALSPTGTTGFHVPMKFAHFYDGRSHAFEVDPDASDFLSDSKAATDLLRAKNHEAALDAFVALSQREGATDLQKSVALADAALCARGLGDFKQAGQLAAQIPVEAIAKTAQMDGFLAQRQWNALTSAFAGENFEKWPFWQAGAGAFRRGQAHYAQKNGAAADADYQTALRHTTDPGIRLRIFNALASNRQLILKDDDGALEAFREIARATSHTGSAEYFSGIQGAARILSRRGEFDEALEILDLVDAARLSGKSSWAGSFRLVRAKTLQAAGRKDEALKTYRAVLADGAASDRHKKSAREAIEALGGKL